MLRPKGRHPLSNPSIFHFSHRGVGAPPGLSRTCLRPVTRGMSGLERVLLFGRSRNSSCANWMGGAPTGQSPAPRRSGLCRENGTACPIRFLYCRPIWSPSNLKKMCASFLPKPCDTQSHHPVGRWAVVLPFGLLEPGAPGEIRCSLNRTENEPAISSAEEWSGCNARTCKCIVVIGSWRTDTSARPGSADRQRDGCYVP